MQLARILGSNYPYKTNVPAYDATILADGEMIMRSATMVAGATKHYVSASGGSGANTDAEDTLGVLQASSTNCYASKENSKLFNLASAVPSKDASTGLNFLPCIVNPQATYFAFVDQSTVMTGAAVSASTTWSIGFLEDNIDAGWLFTTDVADSSATYSGELRYATASASGSITADSAITTDTSTDVCKVLPIGHRLVYLNAAGTGLKNVAAASSTIYLEIFENWLTHDNAPCHQMRYWEDKGLSGLTNIKVESEIVQLKHCFNYVVV